MSENKPEWNAREFVEKLGIQSNYARLEIHIAEKAYSAGQASMQAELDAWRETRDYVKQLEAVRDVIIKLHADEGLSPDALFHLQKQALAALPAKEKET